MKLVLKSKFNIFQLLILVLLFLGSMNFFNLYFYFLFAAFGIVVVANFRGFIADSLFFVLLILSFSYVLFYPNTLESVTSIIKRFIFPMCYLMGLNFFKTDKMGRINHEDREYQLKFAFVVPALGAFAHYLLNMAINFTSLKRNTVDIWTGEVMPATGQACLAVMAVGVFSAGLFSETTKLGKVFSAIGFISVLAYNLVLAGRTLIVLSVLIVFVALSYAVVTSKSKRRVRIAVATMFVIAVVLIIYTQNVFGLRDWVLGSNLSTRFDSMLISEDSRISTRFRYFANMLDYPLGGGDLRNYVGGYAHELYLDVYSDVGIIGYVAVIAFVVSGSVYGAIVFKNGNISKDLKLLMLCVYISILAEFFLEPILQGVPWMFCTFCFYSGLLKNINIYDKQKSASLKI